MRRKTRPRWWNPRPVEPPRVDERYRHLPALPRAAEAIRFLLARLERWLSGGGELREWIRVNLLVAVVCGTGVLLSVPVITAVLLGVADWSTLLALALRQLIGLALALPPLVLAVVGGVLLWRFGRRRWWRRLVNRQPRYPDDDEENDYYR